MTLQFYFVLESLSLLGSQMASRLLHYIHSRCVKRVYFFQKWGKKETQNFAFSFPSTHIETLLYGKEPFFVFWKFKCLTPVTL